jgi:hypothetical protein
MVAEIDLARTPDGIQDALRRALDDPSLEIYLWSREHERYVGTDRRFSSGDNSPHRLTLDVINPDGFASARIVADESVAHHRELLQGQGSRRNGAAGRNASRSSIREGGGSSWCRTLQSNGARRVGRPTASEGIPDTEVAPDSCRIPPPQSHLGHYAGPGRPRRAGEPRMIDCLRSEELQPQLDSPVLPCRRHPLS